jgi:transposase
MCCGLHKNRIPEISVLKELVKTKSTREIAPMFGVSHVTVWKWLKQYNLEV